MKCRHFTLFFFTAVFCAFSIPSIAADWPKTLQASSGGAMKIYEPQPESLSGNILKIRSAVSITQAGKPDPVFGVLWADINIEGSQNDVYRWRSGNVTNIKFPGDIPESVLNDFSSAFESGISNWNYSMPKNELQAKLNQNQKEESLSGDLNTSPPAIIYTQRPSILVTIDGEPKLEHNPDWNVEQVANTPFTIIKTNARQYYLYGDKRWYTASAVTGEWNYTSSLPSALAKIDHDVRSKDTSSTNAFSNTIAQIVVSTEPAELIQSDGEANFNTVQGTNLLYMTNTGNDIFMDVDSQQYYVLISGRWFRSKHLNSGWSYISANNLPEDFAKIPEGSVKDNVLANVAGTNAASESVMNAQIPQTAKVDRRNATANVTYDGEPEFEDIEGTGLRYAVNTPGPVLNSGKQYYYVDNGVWFQSSSPRGPWYAASQRPQGVEYIPARYPVYNVKYVYIYDATPDYIYTGYTPGYLGTYIYGPTIVYGTGFYYHPWRGRRYYPRPLTWGFSMRYDPWVGWGFGINLWSGWFSMRIGNYYRGPSWGGWWGPTSYRPLYCRPYDNYYGRNRNVYNNYTVINNYRSVNIYRDRRNVVTYDRQGYSNGSNDRLSRPYTGNNGRPGPTTYSSRNGERIPGQPPVINNSGNRRVTRNYEPNDVRGREPFNNGRIDNNSGSNPQRPVRPNINKPERDPNSRNPGLENPNTGNRRVRPEYNIPQQENSARNPDLENPNATRNRTARPEYNIPQRDNNARNPGFENPNPGNRADRPVRPDVSLPQRDNNARNPGFGNRSGESAPRSYGGQQDGNAAPGSGQVIRPSREAAPRQSEQRTNEGGSNPQREGGITPGRRMRGG